MSHDCPFRVHLLPVRKPPQRAKQPLVSKPIGVPRPSIGGQGASTPIPQEYHGAVRQATSVSEPARISEVGTSVAAGMPERALWAARDRFKLFSISRHTPSDPST